MNTKCPDCGATYDDMIVTRLIENGKELFCFICDEFKTITYPKGDRTMSKENPCKDCKYYSQYQQACIWWFNEHTPCEETEQ